ncbi:PKD domain-containing protein [Alteromonas sp. ASW11-130]|uniref:PKD domain-containing protein n=1 Tax=Alteromonas sp. ASW11-130 TaxID=3015775 RepID=UPI0022427656|nr:hypothetical protein [Alteromonas sp. ASW11-130]MCW8092833.1 hypothetical protein [Alteromonas sp. ASW11-130]
MKYAKLITILMVSSFLTACGGGGGGDGGGAGGGNGGGGGGNPPANVAPTVSVESEFIVAGNSEITITATANDSDGQIDAYLWEVTSSHTIALSGEDTDSVTFTTPDVNNTEEVTLKLTVTDDDGAKASGNVTVIVYAKGTPPPPTSEATLSLQGKVLDSADIAEITVLLNGEEFPADVEMLSSTTYLASITVEGAERERYLSIKGSGEGASSHVAMLSLVGKVNDLIEQAQGNKEGDETLTSDENFSVNLSSITTAKYGLIKQHNGATSVHSMSAVETGMSSLGTIALQNWASAVLVAVADGDTSGTLALPANIDNTLELVESSDAVTTYLENVFYTEEFKTAKSELFFNSAYYNTLGSLTVPLTLYFNPKDGLNFSLFPMNGLTHSLILNDDGTGKIDKYNLEWGVAPVQGVNNAAINIAFDDEGHLVTTDADTGTKTLSGLSKMQLILIDQPVEGRAHFIAFTESEQIVGESAPTVTGSEVNLLNASLETTTMPKLSETVYVPLPREKFSSQYILENTNAYGKATQYEEIKLNADGSGSAIFTGADITWSKNGDTLSISGLSYYDNDVNFYSPEDTITYNVVSQRKTHQVTSATVKKAGASEPISIATGAAVLNATESAWTTENAPGYYIGNFRAVSSRPLDSFFVELKENGHADVYYTTDGNEDGKLVETNNKSTEVTHLYGTWNIESDGSLKFSTFTLDNLATDPSCRAEDPATGCKIYEVRTWRKIAEEGNEIMVTNKRYFNWLNRSPLEPDIETNSLATLTKSDAPPVSIE